MEADRATFWEHIEELRKLLIGVLATIFFGFCVCIIGYQTLFNLLIAPLDQTSNVRVTNVKEIYNPNNSPVSFYHEGTAIVLQPGQSATVRVHESHQKLVILSPLEGMSTMLKLCLWTSVVVTSPFWLYLVFLFISPALEKPSKRHFIPFIAFLFCFGGNGLLFARLVTIPLANAFFETFNEGLGHNLWSLSYYIDYSIILLLSHVLMFEFAAVLLLFVHYGWISAQAMIQWRRHVYVILFILAAILTPPDIMTQISLGIPMVIFYELILLYGKFRENKATVPEIL